MYRKCLAFSKTYVVIWQRSGHLEFHNYIKMYSTQHISKNNNISWCIRSSLKTERPFIYFFIEIYCIRYSSISGFQLLKTIEMRMYKTSLNIVYHKIINTSSKRWYSNKHTTQNKCITYQIIVRENWSLQSRMDNSET